MTCTSHSWTAPKRRALSCVVLSRHCILKTVSPAAVRLKTWHIICTLRSISMSWSRVVSGGWPTSCASPHRSSNREADSSYASPCIPLNCKKRSCYELRRRGEASRHCPYPGAHHPLGHSSLSCGACRFDDARVVEPAGHHCYSHMSRKPGLLPATWSHLGMISWRKATKLSASWIVSDVLRVSRGYRSALLSDVYCAQIPSTHTSSQSALGIERR